MELSEHPASRRRCASEPIFESALVVGLTAYLRVGIGDGKTSPSGVETLKNASSEIQVDAFEVGLGAALLVQYRGDGGTIRILADGGMDSKLPAEHVNKKLADAFAAFGHERPRIDLVIGTHYDGDHLKGLVPIIENGDIEIGDVWLPPVANDVQPARVGARIDERNMLGSQFAADATAITSYLRRKADQVRELHQYELAAGQAAGDESERVAEFIHMEPETAHDYLTFFDRVTDDALEAMGIERDDPLPDDVVDPQETIDWMRMFQDPWRRPGVAPNELRYFLHRVYGSREDDRSAVSNHGVVTRQLAHARSRVAREAITSVHLNAVVRALRVDRPAVPVSYRLIQAGQPSRYAWNAGLERFVPTAHARSDVDPELILLGPSEGLVERYRDRLPSSDYARNLAMLYLTDARLVSKYITPSNQLSYVMRLGLAGQRLLICGDAGMVDFRPAPREPFYGALIDELRRLHFVQVAHHGGNNMYFYDALRHAAFGEGSNVMLLFSHAADDRHRPSAEFGQFLGSVPASPLNTQLLFTGRPQAAKVRDFAHLAAPLAGTSAPSGDVRVRFEDGRWEVEQHSVDLRMPPAIPGRYAR